MQTISWCGVGQPSSWEFSPEGAQASFIICTLYIPDGSWANHSMENTSLYIYFPIKVWRDLPAVNHFCVFRRGGKLEVVIPQTSVMIIRLFKVEDYSLGLDSWLLSSRIEPVGDLIADESPAPPAITASQDVIFKNRGNRTGCHCILPPAHSVTPPWVSQLQHSESNICWTQTWSLKSGCIAELWCHYV